MQLGKFDLCLKTQDVNQSAQFYQKLGFTRTGGDLESGWCVLKRPDCTLALYERHISENILNFRGEDVFKLAAELKAKGLKLESEPQIEPDGSQGASLRDPDGNLIYLNTHPSEMRQE